MKDKEFLKLCDEAIQKADDLIKIRGDEYDKGELHITDYFDCINNPEKAAFVFVHAKTLRLKSLINHPRVKSQRKIEELLDLINYARFLYAILK